MRRLIISNTHYQTIFAIQLRLTIFKSDEVFLIISDHSRGSEEVCARLKLLNIFNEIYYVKSRECVYKNSKRKEWDDFFKLTFCKSNRYSFYLINIKNPCFDEVVAFNYDSDLYGLHAILSRINPNIEFSMMEEGIITYSKGISTSKKLKLCGRIRNLTGKKKLCDSLGNFYCYYPQIYKGNLNPINVPVISNNSEISQDLKFIFGLKEKIEGYKQKFIFFTSVYDFEGGKPVGEYELVCKIADLVGKDNLLVKTHPRDTRSIYTDNGFNVDKNSSIPWEAIQLSGDFSDKIFMTINSGSVLSGSTMSEKTVRTYYMYKLCDISGNESCKKNARDIESLLQNDDMKKILKTVHIAEKLVDIL